MASNVSNSGIDPRIQSSTDRDAHLASKLIAPAERAIRHGPIVPTVARIGPYRFFFFGNEGLEPMHIHVQRDRALAKFWLQPVALASSTGLAAHEIRRIQRLVQENRQRFEEAWREFFIA